MEIFKDKSFQLGYYVSSGGDGSANTRFFSNVKRAETAEEEDFKEFGDGWGEPSWGKLDLFVDSDGAIYYTEAIYDNSEWNKWYSRNSEIFKGDPKWCQRGLGGTPPIMSCTVKKHYLKQLDN